MTRDHWKLAREAGARITTHVGVGSYGLDAKFEQFGRSGVLGPDTTYIHCTTLNDTEIQMIVDTGGTVSLAAPVEMMMGHGMPPIQKFLDRGLNPSLSVDVETNVPGDMFNQMRSVLALQRAFAAGQGKAPIVGSRRPRVRHHRGGQGQRPRRQGGVADAGQEGRHHHAAHRPDERDAAR